jgi:hypothetical protein
MKIKHHSIFTDLSSTTIDWNYLRDSNQESSYFIPFSKRDYLALVENLNYLNYVDPIVDYCKEHKISSVLSIGSGKCGLEYHIKTTSGLKVIVSDTSNSILRIKSFTIFDDAYQLDLLDDSSNFYVDANTLVLLSRVDTEFNDTDFKKFFSVLQSLNVLHVCLIPAELLSLKSVILELRIFLLSILKKKKRVFCGYARSKSAFQSIWKEFYSEFPHRASKKIFFLKKQ